MIGFPKALIAPAAAVAVALGITLALWLAWNAVDAAHQEAARARSDATFADARTNAAKAAITTLAAGADRDAAIDQTTEKSRAEIRNQPDAEVAAPATATAGRRAVCLRRAARSDPQCVRLLGPNPR